MAELGYDVYEDKRDFIQDGLTGDVRRYATEEMQYPCIIITGKFKEYKLSALKQMFSAGMSFSADGDSGVAIYFYAEEKAKCVRLGKIGQMQVKSFLRLFEDDKMTGYYDSNTVLDGDYLYVLA